MPYDLPRDAPPDPTVHASIVSAPAVPVPAALGRIREALHRAGYTVPAVRELLGPVAGGALARDEIVPALRATGGTGTGSEPALGSLESLVRLFWLQVPVRDGGGHGGRVDGHGARAGGDAGRLADDLVAAGLAERSGGELRATVHIEPLEPLEHLEPLESLEPHELLRPVGPLGSVAPLRSDAPIAPLRADEPPMASGATAVRHEPATRFVVSDLKARPGSGTLLRPDHVVGAGGASAALARLVVHRAVDNALDLGTGSGVQALHLAGRARRITATDVNGRALRLAELGFALSGVDGVELLNGSLFEPVAARRFDLIVSNPPFVISPDGRFSYRESGLPGDEVCRRLVTEAADHLADGGWCHLLANWLHVGDAPWEERVGGWIHEAAGCDAWVVQRDVQDPAEYAELWLRDSCEHGTAEYRERYDRWLEHFERQGVAGIGFGWITLRRSGAAAPAVRIEELRHEVEQPVGAYVEKVMDGLAAAAKFSTEFSTGDRLRAVAGLVQEQLGPPGAEDPERIVLRQTAGLRRAAGVETIEAALAGVCDGTLPLDPLLDAIAGLMGLPAEDVRAHAEAVLPELIADGFFEPESP